MVMVEGSTKGQGPKLTLAAVVRKNLREKNRT